MHALTCMHSFDNSSILLTNYARFIRHPTYIQVPQITPGSFRETARPSDKNSRSPCNLFYHSLTYMFVYP